MGSRTKELNFERLQAREATMRDRVDLAWALFLGAVEKANEVRSINRAVVAPLHNVVPALETFRRQREGYLLAQAAREATEEHEEIGG